MSADNRSGQTRSLPADDVEAIGDGRTLRVHWRASREARATAVFSVKGDFAVLQYTRTTFLRQRGPTTSERTDDPDLDEIPWGKREAIRARGFEPIDELFGEVTA